MALEPGTRLGPYEVLAPIGAGPDERYKASDTRLNRVVALKVLPSEFSENPEMKERSGARRADDLIAEPSPDLCARRCGASGSLNRFLRH